MWRARWKRSTARQQGKHRLKVLSADYCHPVRRSKRTLNARQDKSATVSINFPTAKQISRFSLDVLSLFIVLYNIYIHRRSPLSSRLTALLSHVILNEWPAFYGTVLNIHRSVAELTWLVPACHMKLLPSRPARSVYTMHCVTSLYTKPHT